MGYIMFRVLLAIVIAVSMVLPTPFVEAWHGSGGPTGTGIANMGPQLFMIQLAPLLPDVGYRTCLIGNFEGIVPGPSPSPPPPPPGSGQSNTPSYLAQLPPNPGHARIHHWKFLSRAGGMVKLLITASSVGASDIGGSIKATAEHASGVSSITVYHSGISGTPGDVSAVLEVPTVAGVPYALDIESTGLTAPGGHHYKLGVLGPGARRVELGYGEPILEYHEPGRNRWAINIPRSSSTNVIISVDPPLGGVPGQATHVDYEIIDPSGVDSQPPAGAPVSPASPIIISVTNTNPDAGKTFIVQVNGNGHYKLDRAPGPDRGIYALSCPENRVNIDIKPGSFPNSINLKSKGTVPVAILSTPIFDAATVNITTVRFEGASVALKNNGSPMAESEDVNGDGRLDLVLHFEISALQLTPSDTVANLGGVTNNLQPFFGSDSVNIVQN